MNIRIQVPATSANLGPGFDCFGLALQLYNFVTVETGHDFRIALSGNYVRDIPADETNLVWQTMVHFWQEAGFPVPNVALSAENNIPPARGLGSSSAAIVAGILAANALIPHPWPKEELLQFAGRIEGHPDNVTPALYGGVTLAVPTPNGILPEILPVAPHLRAVVVIPDLLLKTEKARHILPAQVSRSEAVFNIAHAALLVRAFMSEKYELLGEAMQDKLHQDQRAALIPGMPAALRSALEAGAYGSALSGSGPTLLALTGQEAEQRVAAAMLEAIRQNGTGARSYILDLDLTGAKII